MKQVPLQPNSKDCACFAVFFRQFFFFEPGYYHGSGQGLSDRCIQTIYTNFQCQTLFASTVDVLAAWGLKNYDISFVHREIRTIIFKYIHQGDAVVEYDD